MMKLKRWATLAVTMAACVCWAGPSLAQEGAAAFDLPEGWLDRPSGVSIGLEMNRRAAEEGRDQVFEFDFRPRPPLAAQVAYQGRNVLVINDDDGQIQRLSVFNDGAWNIVADVVYSYFPDHFDMIMLLTTFDENRAQGFYRPLANHVRGIGYQHSTGLQVFNTTNSEALDGTIFMNNYRTYLGRNAPYGRFVFLQEIGHRWGSYAWYGGSPADGRDMLGRDDSHWSYFMHTSNSAMEGNSWVDNENGTFSTNTNAFQMGFSDLDLYMMGFKPATQVSPWFVIHNPETGNQRDATSARLNRASPPEIFGGSVRIGGERHDIVIDDVIRAEGERIPSYADAQKTWRVATVLVVAQGDTFTESNLTVVEDLLGDWEETFEEAIEGEGDLILDLEGDVPIPGNANYGESCMSSEDCNQETSTTCVALDGGAQICSYRCAVDDECGQGYCCAEGFCYPPTQSVCAEPPPECTIDSECAEGCCVEGSCVSDASCQGTGGGETTGGETTGDGGGLLGGGGGEPGLINSSGSADEGCSAVAGGSSPVAPVVALGVVLGSALLRRRR